MSAVEQEKSKARLWWRTDGRKLLLRVRTSSSVMFRDLQVRNFN